MALTGTAKRIAIVAALAGAVLLLDQLFGPDDSAKAVVGAPKPQRSAMSASARAATAPEGSTAATFAPARDIGLERLDRRQAALGDSDDAKPATDIDPFGAVSWKPPEAPQAHPSPPPPPPKPVAPPFPYAYLGALTEDGVRTAFFSKGERVLPVKAGDVVDAAYRVDAMTDKQMTVTYMPLNESLVVALGAGQ